MDHLGSQIPTGAQNPTPTPTSELQTPSWDAPTLSNADSASTPNL